MLFNPLRNVCEFPCKQRLDAMSIFTAKFPLSLSDVYAFVSVLICLDIYWRYWYEQSLHDFSILFIWMILFSLLCILFCYSFVCLFVVMLAFFLFIFCLPLWFTYCSNIFFSLHTSWKENSHFTHLNLNLISNQVWFRTISPLSIVTLFCMVAIGEGYHQIGFVDSFMFTFTFVWKFVTLQTHVE